MTRQILAIKSLRLRLKGGLLFLLTLAAALFTLGGPCYPPPEGLNSLAITSDGALIARAIGKSALNDTYTSYNGGLAWQVDDFEQVDTSRDSSAVTPQGASYAIEGTRIVRINANKRETVYDAGYLRDKANLVLQYRATGEEHLTKTPRSIVQDPASNNLVVAMGWDGVVVITPEGEATRIAVGPYVPTNFSATARLKLMFTSLAFWVSSLMVAVSFFAVIIILPRCRLRELLTALAVFATGSGFISVSILAIFANIGWLWSVSSSAIVVWLMLLLPLILIPAFLLVLLKVLPVESSRRIGLSLCLALLLAAAAVMVFPGFGVADITPDGLAGDITLDGLTAVLLAVTVLPIVLVVVAAAIPYRPDGTKIWTFLWPLGATMLIIVFVTFLWMLYVIPGSAAEWSSLVLAAGISALTFVNQRGHQRRINPARELAH